jgi:hypothetical protein
MPPSRCVDPSQDGPRCSEPSSTTGDLKHFDGEEASLTRPKKRIDGSESKTPGRFGRRQYRLADIEISTYRVGGVRCLPACMH